MKKILCAIAICIIAIATNAQNKVVKPQANTTKENKTTSENEEAIKLVLNKYKTAIEKLDITGTETLFTSDSKIYESGSNEGTYAHYVEHHLGPELKEFKSFSFNNYKVEVQEDGNYAFATESYTYIIVLAKDNAEVIRKGVATSVFKKINGEWKIMITHSSSRK